MDSKWLERPLGDANGLTEAAPTQKEVKPTWSTHFISNDTLLSIYTVPVCVNVIIIVIQYCRILRDIVRLSITVNT